MLRVLLAILLFSSLAFAKSFAERPKRITEVKDYQMSEERGRLYVLLTNVTHMPDYPMSIYFYSNCEKEEKLSKDKAWKKAEMIDMKRFCDVDFEKTKINSQGTVLSFYVKKTDIDDLNRSDRPDTAGPKCLSAEWVHIDLKGYCLKD